MNSQIERLDARIKQLTGLPTRQATHVRHVVTRKLRAYQGDMYDVDLRLEGAPYRLGYQYFTSISFSACSFNFVIDIVID